MIIALSDQRSVCNSIHIFINTIFCTAHTQNVWLLYGIPECPAHASYKRILGILISSDNIKNPTYTTWLTLTFNQPSTSSKLRRPLSEYLIVSAPDAFLGSVFLRTSPATKYTKIAHCHSVPSLFRRPELSFTSSVGFILESSESLQCRLLPQKKHEIWKHTVSKVQTSCSGNAIFTRSPTLLDGLKVIERFFNVPLDHAKPEGEKIRIFARHIIPKDKAKTLEDEGKLPFRECQSTEANL